MSTSFVFRPRLVTIAIPTFNRVSLLKDCILSALSQTYQQFEILVSDNASTDGTAELLGQFQDPRLRVLRQTRNIGALPNWNVCLAQAKGEYIIFLSDDDSVKPWFLEKCIALIETEPKLAIVVALSERSDSNARRSPAICSQELTTGIWDGATILSEYLKDRITAHICTMLFRTDDIRALGGFPNDMPHTADAVMIASALLKGRAGFVNECCGTCRFLNSSETSRLTVDVRLGDCQKLYRLISNMAERSIEDLRKVRNIKLDARQHYLLAVAYVILGHCSNHFSFRETLSVLWRWRADLIPAAMCFLRRQAKRLARHVLPESVIKRARQLTSYKVDDIVSRT
jgi:glycosyltransferase involved in cell wall biosynthesis